MTLPQGWKKVKFGELAEERSNRVDNPSESGFDRYVGLEHLDSGSLVVKRWGSTKDVTSAMKLFKEGDILFARRNTYLKRVSVAQFDGVCSGDIIVLQPILKQIIKDFLPIFMQFEDFENTIISLSAGAFSKRIKWKQLADENFHIPSLEEQKKMVEFIWAIQGQIRLTGELISLTEKLKRGLLNELLTRGIGHKKFKKTKLGEIPEDWEVISAEQLVLNEKGSIRIGPFGSQLHKKHLVKEGFKVYGQENVFNKNFSLGNRYLTKERYELLKSCKLLPGDFVITMMGTIGKSTIVPENIEEGIMDSHLLRLRIDESLMYKPFIAHVFSSELIQRQINYFAVGGIMAGLSGKVIKKLIFPKPSLEEQKSITEMLDSINGLIYSQAENLGRIVKLKKKLTDEFLSGRILLK